MKKLFGVLNGSDEKLLYYDTVHDIPSQKILAEAPSVRNTFSALLSNAPRKSSSKAPVKTIVSKKEPRSASSFPLFVIVSK